MWTIRRSRRQEILISKYVWIKRPYHSHCKPSLDILRCECMWQWLTHYECDVVDCHLFLQDYFWSVPQSRCSQTSYKVHKLTCLRVAMWERYEVEMTSPLHTLAKYRTFISRCDWPLSTRINIGLSFLKPLRFTKCSMNCTKLSPVTPPWVVWRSSTVIWPPCNEVIPALLWSEYEEWRDRIPTQAYSHSHCDQGASLCGGHCSDQLHAVLCYDFSCFLDSCYCS